MNDPHYVVSRLENTRKPAKTYSKSKINTPTKAKARQLLQKENTTSKKSRLECLLFQQMQAKYGSRQPNSQLNKLIKSVVHEFISSCDDIENPGIVSTLEQQVESETTSYKRSVKDRSQRRSDGGPEDHSSTREGKNVAEHSGSINNSSSRGFDIDPNQWSVLNAVQTISLEEQNKRERDLAQLKKLKFRDELDQQLAMVDERKKKANEEKVRVRQEVERVTEAAEREKEAVKQMKVQKFEHDRALIEQQIEERRRRREMEREQSILEDQIDMRRAKARAQEEEDLKAIRKMKQKASQEELRLENERVKAAKKEAIKKQYEMEKKMEEEYRAKLDREEQARKEAFNKRMEKMNQYGSKYSSEGAGAKERETALKNEIRLQEEIERKNKAEEEESRRRAEASKERTRLAAEENLRIIREKERSRGNARQESSEMRAKFLQDSLKEKEEKERQIELKRQKALETKRCLDAQIEEKRRRQSDDMRNGLSSRERELNQPLLKKIEQDPALQEAIYARLHPSKRRDATFAFA